MNTALDTVRAIYDAFGKGDIPSVLGAMKADVRWTEAEGGPYGGTYTGPQAVLDNVFMKLGSEWDTFSAVPREFVANGNVVVALGEYTASYKATGKSFKAPFAHVWRLDRDRVGEFQQYTDTHVHRQPMQ
jgi:uncharacterized protein